MVTKMWKGICLYGLSQCLANEFVTVCAVLTLKVLLFVGHTLFRDGSTGCTSPILCGILTVGMVSFDGVSSYTEVRLVKDRVSSL